MVAEGWKVEAVSARSHTRKQKHSSSSSGLPKKLWMVLLIGLAAWSYQEIQPPSSRICGSPNGPPITSPRVTFKDGRHLAYLEFGVPKEMAKYHIIFVHPFDSSRHGMLPISQELLQDLGGYLLSFDRPGYGESDPDPKRTEKSIALDIEELSEQLELKQKLHLIGFSMGGALVWGCLKYIPHRIAGAVLLAPHANYWWPGFPANVTKEAFSQKLIQDQWAERVTHYVPQLTYWWNTQKWFPSSGVIARHPSYLSIPDLKLIPKLIETSNHQEQSRQQGEFESLHRDMIVGFGTWEFDPMDLDNPFTNGEGSVHLWHGADDLIAPVLLSRYISQRLPWVRYHELQDAGHLFPFVNGMAETIVKTLLLGES